jgi:hypothetical protein
VVCVLFYIFLVSSLGPYLYMCIKTYHVRVQVERLPFVHPGAILIYFLHFLPSKVQFSILRFCFFASPLRHVRDRQRGPPFVSVFQGLVIIPFPLIASSVVVQFSVQFVHGVHSVSTSSRHQSSFSLRRHQIQFFHSSFLRSVHGAGEDVLRRLLLPRRSAGRLAPRIQRRGVAVQVDPF